ILKAALPPDKGASRGRVFDEEHISELDHSCAAGDGAGLRRGAGAARADKYEIQNTGRRSIFAVGEEPDYWFVPRGREDSEAVVAWHSNADPTVYPVGGGTTRVHMGFSGGNFTIALWRFDGGKP